MAQAQFVHIGDAIDHTPAADVAAGDVVEVGTLPLVARHDIPAGALGSLAMKGVFDVVKATGAITVGALVYWDNDGDPVGGVADSGAATTTPTDNNVMGRAVAAAASADETVRVKLMQPTA